MNRHAVVSITLALIACAKQTRHEPPVPAASSSIQAAPGDARAKDGIRYVDSSVGTGAIAEKGKCVYTHYTGFLTDGRKFDSSHNPGPDGKPGTPIAFLLGAKQVITGWEIGFEGMRVGGKRRLFVPPALGYGPRGAGGVIPPNADLVFDVELMGLSEPRPNRTCRPWR